MDYRVSDAGLRFPFVPHLPALPAINPRGELEGRIFRRCRLIVSGLPRTAFLRYRRRPSSKFPWNLYPPAPADEAPRVSSVRSPSGFARENLRVTPNLLWPLAPSTDLAPYRHGASVLRRCRLTGFRFAPNPCPSATPFLFPRVSSIRLNGWVDDEPWLSSNFASPDCAVDESSRPIRFRSLCLTLDALSISSALDYRLAPTASRDFNQSASPVGL